MTHLASFGPVFILTAFPKPPNPFETLIVPKYDKLVIVKHKIKLMY